MENVKRLERYLALGFDFRLVERKGSFAIFEGNKTAMGMRTNTSRKWEVIRILVTPEKTVGGDYFPARERAPSKMERNEYVFKCATLEQAREKLNELIQSCI
jgi:hypothetical protein